MAPDGFRERLRLLDIELFDPGLRQRQTLPIDARGVRRCDPTE
jgi:hypothetical protein